MKNYQEIVNWIDNDFKPKRKGIRISKRALKGISIGLVLALVISVSGGLLQYYAKMSATINVTETALKVNGENCPQDISATFENAKAGDIFYQQFWLNNTLDDYYFNATFSFTCDEGLTGTLLNEIMVEQPDPLGLIPFENRSLTIEWEISPIAETGTYEGLLTIEPFDYQKAGE